MEARRILRRIELEAYGGIVSAFRAEGQLTIEKKAVLTKLSQLLSISADRHHAEVRRAICDEQLSFIADCVSGGTDSRRSWLPEGKRSGGRGNPRLVARHALSGTLQGQALAAVTLSNINKNKPQETNEETDRKLPTQVQMALKTITAQHQSSSSSSAPPPAPPPPIQRIKVPSVTLRSISCQTDSQPVETVGIQVIGPTLVDVAVNCNIINKPHPLESVHMLLPNSNQPESLPSNQPEPLPSNQPEPLPSNQSEPLPKSHPSIASNQPDHSIESLSVPPLSSNILPTSITTTTILPTTTITTITNLPVSSSSSDVSSTTTITNERVHSLKRTASSEDINETPPTKVLRHTLDEEEDTVDDPMEEETIVSNTAATTTITTLATTAIAAAATTIATTAAATTATSIVSCDESYTAKVTNETSLIEPAEITSKSTTTTLVTSEPSTAVLTNDELSVLPNNEPVELPTTAAATGTVAINVTSIASESCAAVVTPVSTTVSNTAAAVHQINTVESVMEIDNNDTVFKETSPAPATPNSTVPPNSNDDASIGSIDTSSTLHSNIEPLHSYSDTLTSSNITTLPTYSYSLPNNSLVPSAPSTVVSDHSTILHPTSYPLSFQLAPSSKRDNLIMSSSFTSSITAIPSLPHMSSNTSTASNVFFPSTESTSLDAPTVSTPTSPFITSNVNENDLLKAVTSELGVDSIDPSLLNMSDLLSLLQPDDDPLTQLELTTSLEERGEEGERNSSEMIVLQQSEGLDIVKELTLNEEELLENLPEELRETVQAILENQ